MSCVRFSPFSPSTTNRSAKPSTVRWSTSARSSRSTESRSSSTRQRTGAGIEIKRGSKFHTSWRYMWLDFKLSVGGTEQQIVVEGGAPLLNTVTTEVGNVINMESTEQLPLNGRNFSQLGLLVPGTAPGPVGGIRTQGNGNETQRAGAEIVANGSRGSFNTFMIDGLDDRDQSVGTAKVFPNLESIEEFKVQIGNYDAEFASGGAVVNVITKSGSNEIHGSAFEFLRNKDLNSRQFFDASEPPFQQNQFGFSVGGPIKKNKLFAFGDYQGLRIHTSSTSILTEPTAALRAGTFTGYPSIIYNPTTYNATTNTDRKS